MPDGEPVAIGRCQTVTSSQQYIRWPLRGLRTNDKAQAYKNNSCKSFHR